MSIQISSTQNASPSIPDDLGEKTFDEGATQLAFDVQKGKWIFTTSSMLKITKVVAKEIFKHAILYGIAGAVGGSVLGILSRRVTYCTLTKLTTWMVGGAISGAIAGAIREYSSPEETKTESIEAHLRIKHISDEKEQPQSASSEYEILTALFEKVQEGTNEKFQIVDPISGGLLFMPVKTQCGHIFEHDYLKSELTRDPRCRSCEEEISFNEVSLERGIRLKVIEIAMRTLTWLANQQSDESIDVFNESQAFLENPQELIQKINSNQLEEGELAFLSHLVRREIHDYNKKLQDVFKAISDNISENRKKLGREEFRRLVDQLDDWTGAFEIQVPGVQGQAPQREDPV